MNLFMTSQFNHKCHTSCGPAYSTEEVVSVDQLLSSGSLTGMLTIVCLPGWKHESALLILFTTHYLI